jgi:hypothetical protein
VRPLSMRPNGEGRTLRMVRAVVNGYGNSIELRCREDLGDDAVREFGFVLHHGGRCPVGGKIGGDVFGINQQPW